MADWDMDIHGQALIDYLNGEKDTYYILRRDDGIAYPPIYAKQFFYPEGLPEIDRIAIGHCKGRVLDIGAGAGSHSLAIQNKGLDVTAIEISSKAVEVMTKRGVKRARVADVFDTHGEWFDTVLVICNIGIVQNLEGLDKFLKHLDLLLESNGQLITDSIDPRDPSDEDYKTYQQKKTGIGRYFGERTLRFEYKGQNSDWFEWMHIDPDTLKEHVEKVGWKMEILGKDGKRYLVSISRE